MIWVHDFTCTAVGKEIVDLWSSQGATVGWIGVDKVAVGVYGVADQLRTEAIEAVRNLKVCFICHLETEIVICTNTGTP